MISVKRVEKTDWQLLAKNAHEVVFREAWPDNFERIDYALLTTDAEDKLVQYATIRETDAISAYIQYGGSFPDYRGSVSSYRSFRAIIDHLFEQYKNVSFLVENTNLPMLKFALKEHFIIIGIRNFKNQIMLEHFKTREA